MLRTVVWVIFLAAFFTSTRGHYAKEDFFKDESFFGGFFTEKGLSISSSSSFNRPNETPNQPIDNDDRYFNIPYHRSVNSHQTPSEPRGVRAPGCGTPPDSCPKTKYRSYDGSCNNLRNPVLGTPNTPYNRFLPANYADGISNPPLAKSGADLPLARSISLLLYPDIPVEDPIFTLIAMQFAQIITHDMSMTAGNPQIQHYKTRCCSKEGQLLELAKVPEHCFPIILPYNDPAHSPTKTRCMSFDRTITNRDRRCVGGSVPAEQLTSVNHYLDLSIVYGNNDEDNHQLRNFEGGRLRVEKRNGWQWPPRAVNASGTCRLKKRKDACYLAGDTRVNQNPQLTLLQVVLLREHNRIADELFQLNPHWNDEILFQEARKINIAQFQHISYYEWLPYFIGWENSLKNKIVWNTQDYVNDYDEDVDPSVLNEHAAGAFRHFHSLIVGHLHLVHEKRFSHGSLRLSDWLVSPEVVEKKFDELARGLTTQPQSASDQFHDSEVTQFLFRQANDRFGIDLKAFDIQRSRDHGLASYNDYREFWKMRRARSFEDFSDLINEENVAKLASLYESPDDVDLIVGGSLEINVPGTLVGPTFLRILTEQFYRTRTGDRFWYENDNGSKGFTLEQLQQIRKASIARLLCDNGHHLRNMQPKGFERITRSNPLTSCRSLPSIDLSAWKNQRFGNIPFLH